MIDAVQPIDSTRPVDERYDRVGVWLRRLAMCLLTAVVVVALANVVGQRAATAHAASSRAVIEVRAPTAVRPGLIFQAKISITARSVLPDAQLELSSGWVDGLTINTLEPSPSAETSGPDGSLRFDIGALQPGQTWVQYVEYQVNPTSLSRRHQAITLLSDTQPVVTLNRTMTVVP
ncbi:MAG TPA: hypothetical protein VHA79_00350 [Mycobacteriales bacterium]|jgi:hypothetical protein|nr:hypothetical protein [Mycobacteriales bacterium]